MRRILFGVVMATHYLLGLPLLGIAFLIGKVNKDAMIRIAYFNNRITSFLLYWVSGAKIHIKGAENLQLDEPVVYIGNHRSMLDIPLLMKHTKKPIIFIGKKSVAKWPIVGWWMKAMGCLFIERNPRADLKVILNAIDMIKEGYSFVIFPEGTRSRSTDMLPFKQGSLKLASKPNVPVVPFAIKGTNAVFEDNKVNLKPENVYFTIGEPIRLDELEPEQQKKSAVYIQHIVQDMMDEMPIA